VYANQLPITQRNDLLYPIISLSQGYIYGFFLFLHITAENNIFFYIVVAMLKVKKKGNN